MTVMLARLVTPLKPAFSTPRNQDHTDQCFENPSLGVQTGAEMLDRAYAAVPRPGHELSFSTLGNFNRQSPAPVPAGVSHY